MEKIMIGIILWLGMVPFGTGMLVLFLCRRKMNIAEIVVNGYFSMFAICQMIAIPLILMKVPFHLFCMILAAIYLLVALTGFFLGRKEAIILIRKFFRELFHHAWTVYAAAAAVAVQAYHYIPYMVTNLDDAYFVAVATTAIETDAMYLFSPYTGRVTTGFNLRYCLSPFSMWQAFLSKCIGVHPSTLDHTILAPVLVWVAYMVYIPMGRLLFREENEKAGQTEKMTGLFLLFLSMIHVTSYYCVRNQGSVLLLRIWQGKAVLAALLIPYLFYHCYRMAQKPEEKGNTVILLLTSFACCLVSSMGIALPVVLLGIFGILFGVLKKNGKYLVRMTVGMLPCAIYGILYIVLKFLQ